MRLLYFRTAEKISCMHIWSCQNVCDTLTFMLDNMLYDFGNTAYRQTVGIPRDTYCVPLVAEIFFLSLEGLYDVSIWVKYTLLSFNLAKPIPLILKPRFWTCNCPWLMILFLPKFMIIVTILVLKLSIFHFRWWYSSLYILWSLYFWSHHIS